MANNVLPDPLNVNIASPDPLNVAVTGQPLQVFEYLTEVASLKIPGDGDFRMVGRNLAIGNTAFQAGGVASHERAGLQVQSAGQRGEVVCRRVSIPI